VMIPIVWCTLTSISKFIHLIEDFNSDAKISFIVLRVVRTFGWEEKFCNG